ncbi:MAG: hypothetical protein Q7S20_07150 [Gemmatimonadaceae bacterium]|nr:hypothetical protein [Gemmatimonadaceae bacterium]
MRQRGDKNGGGARQSGMTASIHLELLGALSGRQVRQSYVDARLPMYVVSVLLNETVISKN